MFTDKQPQSRSDSTSIAITAPVDMIIPGRTVQLIQAELEEETCNFNEALVEPFIDRALPRAYALQEHSPMFVKIDSHPTGDEYQPLTSNHIQWHEAGRDNP